MISGAWCVAGLAIAWVSWLAWEIIRGWLRHRWMQTHCWLCKSPTIIRDGERRCVRCEHEFDRARRSIGEVQSDS